MKKVSLKEAADEFDMISHDTRVFYNKITGEFDYLNDFRISNDDDFDADKFDFEDGWVFCPMHDEIDEYSMMVEFAEATPNKRKSDRLCVALEGKGAFRRFKDTLERTGLTEAWYAWKQLAYIEIVKKWCKDNGLEYTA